MRLVLLAWLLMAGIALAQSRDVRPEELALSVQIEETAHTPYTREMVLLTIRGVYRRHITRETLVQPDFAGFSWSQLGPDTWREERLDGKLVKVFERRMAVYPDRAGRLRIGAFRHRLTLTDEGDDWFEHEIASEPVEIEVAPAPAGADWWFPTRSLKISDQWSNAPDQLQPGEGVLRVIRLEALGVTPEMIPPMPELNSPSGMIFPHPEKRLVELTPEGPVTYAFWRWTIRPGNDVSTVVEPLTVAFYDTSARTAGSVTISAQRVAYGTLTPEAIDVDRMVRQTGQLPGLPAALAGMLVFCGGLVAGLWRRRPGTIKDLRHGTRFDPVVRDFRRAARRQQRSELRRLAHALMVRDGATPERLALVSDLDCTLFDPARPAMDLKRFANQFLTAKVQKLSRR